MNKEERVLKYINSSDDFVVNGKRYCENDFYNDVEDLAKENKKYKEVIDKIKEYITIYRSYENINGKEYLKGRDEIGTLSLSQVDKLLDILKEVE